MNTSQVYESYPDFYLLGRLPALARLILDKHTEEYARLQYMLSVQYNLPLLKHLAHFSQEELMNLLRQTQVELLEALASNKMLDFIRNSVQRWLANELQVLHYHDVIVEDITLLNHIRAEALRQFIPKLTSDLHEAIALSGEIDRLFMGYTTSSMITFIDLLRQRISSQEAQLLEAEALAHLGSFDWDIRSNAVRSSPEMRKITGTGEPRGLEHFLDLVHPDDSQLLQNAIAEAFVNGQFQCEFRFRQGADQKTLWGRGVVHFDEDGPRRMLGVIQDLSGRKKMEEALLLKTLELERSNEELQQFASIASHDLKEPLRKIVLYTGMIEAEGGEALSPDGRKNLVRIQDAARRMRLLIEDILAFSSLNQEHAEPQLIPLDRLLGDVLELLESRVRETGALVEQDGLPEATVVPYQFRQLFQNLISNSIKFTRPGTAPHIRVSHRFLSPAEAPERMLPAERYLQLEFRDNGIGFPEHYSEKIFALFSRLHSRNTYEGTGLGLAICRKVAENHGGRIEAFSQPGEGATFRVTIPQ
ncbi:hypothetical protein GCM10028786_08410 [Flaviaesturariibacter terrae]